MEKFRSSRVLFTLLFLLLAIPFTVYLSQRPQDLRQRAQQNAANCVYQQTDQNGRPVINVKSFGAKGDGSAGDTAAIQAALNCFKAPAANTDNLLGGAVYLPAGTYLITEKIRLFSNVTFFGDGIDQTVLTLDGAMLTNEDGMLANDTNYGHKNITIRDMTLRGLSRDSGVTQCCVGIKLRQLDGGYLVNIKVEGFSWHGIWMVYKQQTGGATLDTVKNVRISGCQVVNNKGDGIAIDAPSTSNVVDNCTITGNNGGSDADKHMGAGVSIRTDEDGVTTKNKILNNNISSNAFRGISVVGLNGYTSLNNAVCNNTVQGNADIGILDGNSKENKYIANSISTNNGRVFTGSASYYDQSRTATVTLPGNTSQEMVEDPSSSATNPDCAIPNKLATLPPTPPKVGASSGGTPILNPTVAPTSRPQPTATNTPAPGQPTVTPTSTQPTVTVTPGPTGANPSPTLGAGQCTKDADCGADNFCPACKDPSDPNAQCVPQQCVSRGTATANLQIEATAECMSGKPAIRINFQRRNGIGYLIAFNPTSGATGGIPDTLPIIFYTGAFAGVRIFPDVEYHIRVSSTTGGANESSRVVTVKTPNNCASVTPTGGTISVSVQLVGVVANPQHPQRPFAVQFFGANGQKAAEKTGTLQYINGKYQGSVDTSTVAAGDYIVSIKIDGYVQLRLKGLVHMPLSSPLTVTDTMRPGDIDRDGTISPTDFNQLTSCFATAPGVKPIGPCTNSQNADLNDDGKVDILDYNLYRETVIRRAGE